MTVDPRKQISEAFLSDAPGCSSCVDQCLLDGHYHKSLLAAKRCLENTLTQKDRQFINSALHVYVGILIERNFWNLAHLSKERSLDEFDPLLGNAVYRICLNMDELRAILYFDSANTDS